MKYNKIVVLAYFRECGLPEPLVEHKFHPERKWRFDFAWPHEQIALEVEGGIYMAKGGHTSISGIKRDMDKYNDAAALGWRVLRVTPDNLCTQETINLIQRIFQYLKDYDNH